MALKSAGPEMRSNPLTTSAVPLLWVERPADNILSKVDVAILGQHMYRYHPDNTFNFDPEGLMSTLPGIAHVLIGYQIGNMLMRTVDVHKKIEKLFLFGTLAIVGAFLFQYGCPLNKKVWSPTFVIMTCVPFPTDRSMAGNFLCLQKG